MTLKYQPHNRRGKMKKVTLIIIVILLIPALLRAGYSLPASRSVTWTGNVGLGYCSSAYYSKTLCESNGGTWSTTIPARAAIYATVETTDCSTDCDEEIQTQLDNCLAGQTVKLGEGTFTINSALDVPSNVTLRGSGVDVTYIEHSSTGMDEIISLSGFTSSGGNWDDDDGTNITAPSKGDTTISASGAHGLSAGDIVIIDQSISSGNYPGNTSCSGGDCSRNYSGSYNTRTVGQIGRVVSTDGTDFTVEIPVYIDFSSGDDPEVYDLSDQTIRELAGVEDLTITADNVALNDGAGHGAIFIQGSVNCWVYNVKITGIGRTGIKTRGAYRCRIEKTFLQDTRTATSSNVGYMWWISFSTSACLIQNNIVDDGNDTVFTGAMGGNVIAYNYFRNLHNDSYPNIPGKGTFFHGSYSVMNLFEGNYFDDSIMGGAADTGFGEHGWQTYFRNRTKGKGDSAKTQQLGNVEWPGGYNGNFVGNVMGADGVDTVYDHTGGDVYSGEIAHIFFYGSTARQDTMLRHRNWDYVNDEVITCADSPTPPLADCQSDDAENNDTDLPDSLYLTSKPAWFGTITWPPMDPVAPTITDIPAKVAYDNAIDGVPQWPEGSEEASITIRGVTIN